MSMVVYTNGTKTLQAPPITDDNLNLVRMADVEAIASDVDAAYSVPSEGNPPRSTWVYQALSDFEKSSITPESKFRLYVVDGGSCFELVMKVAP
jgi:hypothetical protein